jgi:hypothetical protein
MMLVHLFGRKGPGCSLDPALRGYHVTYREGEPNRCPGCSRSHWHIGRLSAECAFCGTALPLTESLGAGAGLFRSRGRAHHGFLDAA